MSNFDRDEKTRIGAPMSVPPPKEEKKASISTQTIAKPAAPPTQPTSLPPLSINDGVRKSQTFSPLKVFLAVVAGLFLVWAAISQFSREAPSEEFHVVESKSLPQRENMRPVEEAQVLPAQNQPQQTESPPRRMTAAEFAPHLRHVIEGNK